MNEHCSSFYGKPLRASPLLLSPILRGEDVTIVDKLDAPSYGLFVQILDSKGNKIELYEAYLKEAQGGTR